MVKKTGLYVDGQHWHWIIILLLKTSRLGNCAAIAAKLGALRLLRLVDVLTGLF